MSTALHWVTLVLYLAGAALYMGFVASQRRGLAHMGQALLWLGLALHTCALAAAWVEGGVLPAASLRQSLDVFSWALMGASLLINLRLKVLILGAFTAPACVLLLLAASVLPAMGAPPPPALKSLWVVVHVLTMLAGYGMLALTCLGSVLYLMQDSAIRAKRLGGWYRRLPPLGRLDALNQQALVAGFLLMTLGMISGAVYAQIALGSYWRWDPKEVWALVTWLLYAGLMHTRLVQGWRGRRGAWLAVIAFAALAFTFLGAGLLYPGYHSFNTLSGFGEARP